ncbi:unnamed protein product [Allacma fusca]|uniref:Uncharacterized protein n=1 Tax=Allacma fusca TaxID=39272 RepID=A0A8J2K116_9HEXA|nr:unnamed protein product [Allacma fusca]
MNQNKGTNSLPYLGRAPGDLPQIPNKGKETWLTEPVLIFIFMEVVPGIAAIIICFLALTVVTIGVSLLFKYFCLLYSRRLQFKRLKKKKRKISPMENAVEDSTDDMARESLSLKKGKSNPEKTEYVEEDSEEDAEYGILTGTKRKKKESHVARHRHRRHHHPLHFEQNVRKHKARHVVAKIMRRVRDGVMGKQKKKKLDPRKDLQEHYHHYYHQSQDYHNVEPHQPLISRKSGED